MGLDVKDVENFLLMLADSGIGEFEGFGIRVRFKDDIAPHRSSHSGIDADPHRADKAEQAKSTWNHPSLWGPLGKPPEFPKAK